MTILVTGGAGYIGSHMVKALLDKRASVVVVDSLENGFHDAVDTRAQFFQGNLLDKQFVNDVFTRFHFDGVIHFAAYISVGESMQKPAKYFENNSTAAIHLLEAMVRTKSNNIIFSSTAAVYGNPKHVPIPEDHPKAPESPYGESKLMVEHILSWFQQLKGINYTALRYFNASGASLDGTLGERHRPETHIIPNVIKAALNDEPFHLFGTDYPTSDGTCVRDYIHVVDLAEAHLLALQQLQEKGGGYQYNVGTGRGYSNKEVIDEVEKISGKDIMIMNEPKRPGDPAELIADSTRIQNELGFTPHHSDLETIVTSAWKWHSSRT